jgi:hypothetical protein
MVELHKSLSKQLLKRRLGNDINEINISPMVLFGHESVTQKIYARYKGPI